MAGITHSGFRRLIADFGGYGALTTEMLSPPAFLREDPERSPWIRRRAREGSVVYQLRLSGKEDFGALFAKLAALSPAAVDLNLGCPARKSAPGLRRPVPRFRAVERVLAGIRAHMAAAHGQMPAGDTRTTGAPFLERLRLRSRRDRCDRPPPLLGEN